MTTSWRRKTSSWSWTCWWMWTGAAATSSRRRLTPSSGGWKQVCGKSLSTTWKAWLEKASRWETPGDNPPCPRRREKCGGNGLSALRPHGNSPGRVLGHHSETRRVTLRLSWTRAVADPRRRGRRIQPADDRGRMMMNVNLVVAGVEGGENVPVTMDGDEYCHAVGARGWQRG